MNNRKNIEKKVEETLNSLDGIQPASPQPFFYTRVIGKLQSAHQSTWEKIGSFIARPVIVTAGLCMILMLNVALLVYKAPENGNKTVAADHLVTDNEYIIASSSSFDYETSLGND